VHDGETYDGPPKENEGTSGSTAEKGKRWKNWELVRERRGGFREQVREMTSGKER